jgi:hypothetical protein
VVPMAVPSPAALPPGKVLVRQLWAGVNASDINYTDGRHGLNHRLPILRISFYCGAVAGLTRLWQGVPWRAMFLAPLGPPPIYFLGQERPSPLGCVLCLRLQGAPSPDCKQAYGNLQVGRLGFA